MQSQLGLGSYRTAWMLCAKLRRAMVDPEREPLSGVVEADETIILFRTKNDPIVVPAGRSGVGKMLVAGAAEVDGGSPRGVRLKVTEGFSKGEIHAFVLAAVAPSTRLVTDDWPSYNDIPDIKHKAITLGPLAAHIVLPWTHRLILKPQALGSGRLPRTARDKPPALPRRVRVPLQSPPDAACRVQYPSRHRRPYGASSLPPADPQDCLAKLHPTTTAYSATGTSCRSIHACSLGGSLTKV